MNTILILLGNPNTLKKCNKVISSADYSDVTLCPIHDFDTNSSIIDLISLKAPDVIISRGSRAEFLAEKFAGKVVEIPVTPFDFIPALEQASLQNKHVGVIGYKEDLFGLEKFSPLFKIKISTYPIQFRTDLELALKTTTKDGVDAIIAGRSLLEQAYSIPIPCYYVETNEESIKQAIHEARRIAKAISKEKEQKEFIQSFLEHFNGGLIAVNNKNYIIVSNNEAQKIFQLSEKQLLMHKLDDICAELSPTNVLETGIIESEIIIKRGSIRYVCEKVPVKVENSIIGALILIRKVSSLQQAEASIRRKLSETGFIAENYFSNIAGSSAVMLRTVEIAKQFALTDYSVLLLGESGTGKEVFAQSMHNASRRSNGPFVAINCAALPDDLLESELFGYDAGAFTGARAKGKPGMIELAHGGTLFLDEIGEMSLPTQGKLLRVLQEHKLMRLGGDRVLPVNVRIIAATNRNLLKEAHAGKFRKDLYYRLNVLKLQLPPLRNRIDDIPQLIKYFLRKTDTPKNITFSPDAIQALKNYSWPGNIRELQNVLDRILAIYGHSDIITDKVISEILDEEFSPASQDIECKDDLTEIFRALEITGGNYTKASQLLGISRITLWRKLKKNKTKPLKKN